jgi:hypothetical protein
VVACSRRWKVVLGLIVTLAAGCGGSSGSNTGGNSGGAGSTTVSLSFTGGTPIAAATQIGSGPFTAVTSPSSSVTVSLSSGTTNFAVAYVCPPYTLSGTTFQGQQTQTTFQREFVLEGTVADGTAFERSCAAPFITQTQTQTGTLSGTVDASAIPGTGMVWLEGGSGSYWTGSGIGGTVEEIDIPLPLGNDAVAAVASTFNGGASGISILAVRDLGDQTVPGVLNGGNSIVLTAADETTTQPIAYQNSPSGEAPDTSVTFVTAEGGQIFLQSSTSSSYPAVPSAMLNGSAHYTAQSVAGTVDASWVSFNQAWNNAGGPLTVVFPSLWTYSGPVAAALPVFDFTTYSGFTGTSGIARIASEGWQPETDIADSYQVTASANFQGGLETLGMPDLSGISGFLAAPASGATVSWSASINQNSAGAFAATPMNSSTQTVETAGQFAVP